MKKQIIALVTASAIGLSLVGCAGGGTYVSNRQIGAATGALAGGAIGAAASRGNPWATVGGAAAGGVAGYYIGKSTERRQY